MAAVSCVLSEDQFLCSICLEVFTEPVTTPCGHSFCKTCINKHWDISDQYNCPVCKEVFSSRPQLKVNTVVAEMVFEFKNNPEDKGTVNSEPQAAEAEAGGGEVLCDVCSEPKLKALKSCLVCLVSYCQSHLEPHFTVPRLKKHQLIQPVENLEDRICSQHDKPLELYCRDDSKFICSQCTTSEHKNHEVIPMKDECEVKQAEVEQVIKDRRLKIEEIQRSVEDSQVNADREIQEGTELYNDLMKCVQQSLEKFKQSIEEKHKKTEEKAAEFIEKLKSEISELEQSRAQMEELSASEDHLHFLQTINSIKPAPSVKDWTKVTICSTYEGILATAVSTLQDKALSQEIVKVFLAEIKKVKQFAVKVTLDEDTAHPNLDLLNYQTKVQYNKNKNDYPYNNQRFTSAHFVLAEQSFSSGKFYFEVLVKGSKDWAVGVAKESGRRWESFGLSPGHGFWLMEWDNEKSILSTVGLTFYAHKVYLKNMPYRIGVFVDYDKGLVSFYDVDNAKLVHSFTDCNFTENLRPLFSPGEKYGALQIDNDMYSHKTHFGFLF